ncbi:TVP38/TMEM64 family protein [Methylobacter psychrophilus]|uniref:TVP38/TMEM64 family protein n=1 Tax=Methylobacter psychrophilus TaxID=96941 RepID=UPI0021D4F213|nr:VTT domain-containing protein [Methylobacter psychrophilus]
MHLKDLSITKKLSIILALAAIIVVIGHELELYLPNLELKIEKLGAFAPLGFIVLFVLLTPVFVSVDTLCFAAGLLFSLGTAELYMAIATYLASALIFFLGRYLIKDRVISFISKHQHLAALDTAINSQPFKLMFLLRLTPLPFAMLSYALAVTQVKFWTYLAATSGILIYNCSLVYMGYTTKHLAGLVSGSTQQSGVSYPLLALGVIVLLTVLFYVTKIAGESINRLSTEPSGPSC